MICLKCGHTIESKDGVCTCSFDLRGEKSLLSILAFDIQPYNASLRVDDFRTRSNRFEEGRFFRGGKPFTGEYDLRFDDGIRYSGTWRDGMFIQGRFFSGDGLEYDCVRGNDGKYFLSHRV